MIEHELRTRADGEPVLTITVTSGSEIYRLAYHLMGGPIQFGAIAREVFVWLRRRWGIRSFRRIDQEMTGGHVVKHGWHMPPPKEKL